MRPRKHDYESIRSLRRDGLTVSQIATIVGCHARTVRDALTTKTAKSSEDKKQLSLLLTVRQYVKLCEIADKHEVSIGKVIRQYIEKGISDDRAA